MNVCCALLWPDLPEEVAAQARARIRPVPVLKRHLLEVQQVMDYVRFHPSIFSKLMDSYANEEVTRAQPHFRRERDSASLQAALYSGVVLRSFFRYGQLAVSSATASVLQCPPVLLIEVESFLTSGKVFDLIRLVLVLAALHVYWMRWDH